MKKLLCMLFIVLFMIGVGFTKQKKVTEIEKFQAEYQTLAQEKERLINSTNNKIAAIDTVMIRLEGVILYLQDKEKDKK